MNLKSIYIIFLVFFLIGAAVVPSLAYAQLKLTKTCNTYDADLGEQVCYTFYMENVGSEPLKDLELFDDHLGSIDLNKSELAIGENYSISVNYTLNYSDVIAPLINVAQAGAISSNGSVISNNASFALATGYSGELPLK